MRLPYKWGEYVALHMQYDNDSLVSLVSLTRALFSRVLNQSPSLYKFQLPVFISRWIARCSYYDGYAVYYYICVIHFVRVHLLQL